MNQKRRLILTALVIAAALGAGAWYFLHDWFPSAVNRELHGKLRAITFHPYSQSDGITVTDPEMMESIRAAITAARRPDLIASYPEPTNTIAFEFTDGRKEAMLLSWVAAGPERDGEPSFYSMRYSSVMLSWNGYVRIVDSAPFHGAMPKTTDAAPSSDDKPKTSMNQR